MKFHRFKIFIEDEMTKLKSVIDEIKDTKKQNLYVYLKILLFLLNYKRSLFRKTIKQQKSQVNYKVRFSF